MSEWNLGPDTLYPANSYYSTKLNEGVKLRLSDEFVQMRPVSIYTKFKTVVDEIPMYPALAHKVKDKWVYINYGEYWKLCRKAAKSFIKLNLKPNTCVGIIGFNAPAWMISLYGAIFAGGIGCGIYATNSVEACEYALKDSGSEIIVVENKEQLEKMLKLKDKCKITAIIQYTGEVTDNKNGLVKSWDEFINYGNDVSEELLENRIKTIAPNRCATLIYTSGTTGNPKAAMISHDNIVYGASHSIETAELKFAHERLISYLPLSHIAAQLLDCFISAFLGATVFFAQPDALKGSLGQTITEVKPTVFFGVPRVWEKFYEKMDKVISQQSKLKVSLFNWASKVGHKYTTARFRGATEKTLSYWLANTLVLKRVKKTLGFDQCRLFYSGAAPISKKTLEFFVGLGFPICEAFGLSESTGPHILGTPEQNRMGTVGYCKNKFNKTKITNPDENGDGEIVFQGRNVYMGYLNYEEKTKETFDNYNCLLTGDIGRIDKENFLHVTGRIKELIITAGGENVAPVPIEDAIKEQLPLVVSNCMLIGDKRKFLSLLVTIKCKINMDTLEPTDDLTDELIEYFRTIGSNSTKVSDIVRDPKHPIYGLIDKGIKKVNDQATSRASKVQKFSILPKDFSLPGGELGPTLKLRRPVVNKQYAGIIENMYNDDKE